MADLKNDNGDRPNARSGGAHLPNYRTMPCRFYEMGTCNYGDACNFAHPTTGRSMGGQPQQMSNFGGNGSFGGGAMYNPPSRQMSTPYSAPMGQYGGYSMDGGYSTPMYQSQPPPQPNIRRLGAVGGQLFKTVPCKFFNQGSCHAGDMCNFIHPSDPQSIGKMSPAPSMGNNRRAGGSHMANYRTMECRFWSKGTCEYGDSCNFLHDGQPPGGAPGAPGAPAAPPSAGSQAQPVSQLN